MRITITSAALALGLTALASSAAASDFTFSTGNPDGRLGALSRPAGVGLGATPETETADDFVLSQRTLLTSATFTGLFVPNQAGGVQPNVTGVNIEIYRVFPLDSTEPADGNVPTRVNSPSDVALAGRSDADGSLGFSTSVQALDFTVLNSVANGVHILPNDFTGGEGPASGQEVLFNIVFTTPIDLTDGHYFFRPEVALSDGEFLWLSAPRPIVAPGTPFAPDLQAWIRNDSTAPDWLRLGTDITHQGPFNMAFSLNGDFAAAGVPEPGAWLLLLAGLGGVGAALRRRRAERRPATA